jgi:hypothetical protein
MITGMTVERALELGLTIKGRRSRTKLLRRRKTLRQEPQPTGRQQRELMACGIEWWKAETVYH